MIKVIIADDHAIVRTGIRLLLSDTIDVELAEEVSNGDELLRKISENKYDVVILDIHMPGKNSIDTLKAIKELDEKLPVIIFTMNKEEGYAGRFIQNGAAAFIKKESSPDIILQAIRTVVHGKRFFSPSQLEVMADELNSAKESPHEILTDREFQVMLLIASGINKDEIAASLGVSKNTISNHRNNILKKMKLENNSDLTRYALKNGLIE